MNGSLSDIQKAALGLQSFNDMMAFPGYVLKDNKERIIHIDPPDPTGERLGRKRETYRILTSKGRRYYSKESPGDVGDVAKPPEGEEVEGKPAKMEEEVDTLWEDIQGGKINQKQASNIVDEYMDRIKAQGNHLKDAAVNDAQVSALRVVSEEFTNFKAIKDKALASRDEKTVKTALEMVKKIAQNLQSITHSVNESIDASEGKKEEKPVGQKEFRFKKGTLSDAPWEGRTEEIEKALVSPEKSRQSVDNTVNGVFFDELPDGSFGVYRPSGMSVPIQYFASTLWRDYNLNVSRSSRELAAFDLDQHLGFGLVPPIVGKKSKIPQDQQRAQVERTMKSMDLASLESEHVDAIKKSIRSPDAGEEVEGVIQHVVEGAEDAAFAGNLDEMMKSVPGFAFGMQKLAVFDYLIGAANRHGGNFMVNPKTGQVFATDNGHSFPVQSKLSKGKATGMLSKPLSVVENHSKGEIDPQLVRHIRELNTDEKKLDILRSFSKRGMVAEGKAVISRLESLAKAGRIPDEAFHSNHVSEMFARVYRSGEGGGPSRKPTPPRKGGSPIPAKRSKRFEETPPAAPAAPAKRRMAFET